MDLNLTGRKVLITGGSKGIGFAIAQRFASEGCSLYLAARTEALLNKAADSIRETANVPIETFALDLADQAQRDILVEAVPEVDVLVNNAGAVPGGTIDQMDDKTWRRSWELKVWAYIDLSRAYYKKMRDRHSGVIINIIGAGGERLHYDYIAGATGCAGIMGFTKSLGGTSVDFGVRVLGINPGAVETDRMIDLTKKRYALNTGDESRWIESYKKMPYGRPATPDEIAASAVFLASDLSSYTSGIILTIDGGYGTRSTFK